MQVLVTGASGALGSYLIRELARHGHEVAAWSHTAEGFRDGIQLVRVDLAEVPRALAALEEANPEVIIHAAAVSTAAAVLRQREHAWSVNVRGTEVVTEWATINRRRIVFTSTDLVFDGARPWYREADKTAPTLEYGRTKVAAEAAVLANQKGLVVRLSLLYGATITGQLAYFDQAITDLRSGTPRTFFDDEFRTPVDYVSAARILVELAESSATGLMHAGGPERISRVELMRRAAAALGADSDLVRANRRDDVPSLEPRPADVSLDTARLRTLFPHIMLPTIEEALSRI